MCESCRAEQGRVNEVSQGTYTLEAGYESEIRDLLRTYGTVEHAFVVRYKRRVKSAGYGFVEMARVTMP